MITEPSVRGVRLVTTLQKVVLPQPVGPTMHRNSES